jgi:hypothetical protein
MAIEIWANGISVVTFSARDFPWLGKWKHRGFEITASDAPLMITARSNDLISMAWIHLLGVEPESPEEILKLAITAEQGEGGSDKGLFGGVEWLLIKTKYA